MPEKPLSGNDALIAQITSSGPISMMDFMARANTAYYNRRDPLGLAGDFITAPEISQMFGEFVGLCLADLWMRAGSPRDCNYVELGPGRGTLAFDALRSMARFGMFATPHFVEMSEALREKQRHLVEGPRFYDRIADLPRRGPLFIIANEFFDALPIRQILKTEDGWRERLVGICEDGLLGPIHGTSDMEAAIPVSLRNASAGTIVETCPQAAATIFELAGRLEAQGGVAIIIDYGYDEPGVGDTLQAVRGHQRADIFEDPGEQDLSAHVNFPELVAIAQVREARVHGPVRQGTWLKALGIDVRCNQLIAANPEREEELLAAHDRLTSPYQMGSLFKVMAMTSSSWPDPEGFAAARP